MNYYSLPRLIFFKKDGASVDFEQFKKSLFEFIERTFEIKEKAITYGSSSYMSPDKDNQFIEGYIRPVYFEYVTKSHHKFVIHFYEEESSTSTFEKSWMYNFYSLNFYFVQGDEWSWVKSCWGKMKDFMLPLSFYDATFSYTYGGGNLYAHYQSLHDEGAMKFIVEYTTKEELERFQKQNSYIEIQHKPYLDIQVLLSAHPDKQRVEGIQINHNGLEEWPEALFSYTKLQTLNIYNNNLAIADERFSNLKNLITINLNENPLVKNVEELTRLKSFLPKNCSVVFY
jgi:hypothetical protein